MLSHWILVKTGKTLYLQDKQCLNIKHFANTIICLVFLYICDPVSQTSRKVGPWPIGFIVNLETMPWALKWYII